MDFARGWSPDAQMVKCSGTLNRSFGNKRHFIEIF